MSSSSLASALVANAAAFEQNNLNGPITKAAHEYIEMLSVFTMMEDMTGQDESVTQILTFQLLFAAALISDCARHFDVTPLVAFEAADVARKEV